MATAAASYPVFRATISNSLRKPWEVLDQELIPYLTPELVFGPLRNQRLDGKHLYASCPIHKGEEPDAFLVDPNRMDWICQVGCGGGGPVQFLQQTQQLSWIESAQVLAALGGVDPCRVLEWGEHWSSSDFENHERLERRSVLLRLLMASTKAILLSTGGHSVRKHLLESFHIEPTAFETYDAGLYADVADVFHQLKRTGLDLTELRKQGLFESTWSGLLAIPWKDPTRRIVNLIGWDPIQETGPVLACKTLFGRDPLGSHRTPFQLGLAQSLGKQDLLLLNDPVEALVAGMAGLTEPFPIATCGGLTQEQTSILGDYLENQGSLTLLSNYDPETHGTRLDQTQRNLKLLDRVHFPVFVVDARTLAARDKNRAATPATFIRNQGLAEFQELIRLCEVMTPPGQALQQPQSRWPKLYRLFKSPHEGQTDAGSKLDSVLCQNGPENSENQTILHVLLGAAEAIGHRIAQGFLGALSSNSAPGMPLASRKMAHLSQGDNQEPPAFSVDRLEKKSLLTATSKSSGWTNLDSIGARFRPGEFTLVGSGSSHGRTSFLVGLLENWMHSCEDKFVFYSFEESEVQIYHRLLSLLTARLGNGWPIGALRDQPGEADQGSLDQAALDSAKLQLRNWEGRLQVVNRVHWGLDQIVEHLRSVAGEGALGGALIDSAEIVIASSPFSSGAGLSSGRVFKGLAAELDCPLIVTQRLCSAATGTTNLPIESATTKEASEASPGSCNPGVEDFPENTREDADLILGLFAGPEILPASPESLPSHTLPLEVGILKDRYGPSGQWASLVLDPESGRISDPPHPETSVSKPVKTQKS